ncbi:UNVERIFIED_CONTAM: hypothetical protein FKN15_034998 [Acipenser sinensis]
MDVRLCSPVLLTLSLPPPPLATPGFGLFHGLLLVVCGWANASDAVEILCVSFLLPTARCDLQLSSSDMGLLTASIFLGTSSHGTSYLVLFDCLRLSYTEDSPRWHCSKEQGVYIALEVATYRL